MNRILTFGGAGVHLEYTSGRAAGIVEFLFKRIPSAAPGRTLPTASLQLSEDEADGAFTVWHQGDVCCVDRSAGAVASWLLHVTCLRLSREGAKGLLLHSGAVSWGGRSLLLPGTTGSGKSTLTAFLTTRGFEYLTDELAYVPSASTGAEGFSAPLKIKNSGLRALEGRVLLEAPSVVTGPFDVLVDPGDSRCATGAVPLSAIIFPRFQAGSDFCLRSISPAQVGLRLMAGVLNAEALPDHGFREITRVANLTAGYEMRFSSLDQVEAQLETLQQITSGSGMRRNGMVRINLGGIISERAR